MVYRISVLLVVLAVVLPVVCGAAGGAEFPGDQWSVSFYHGEYAASKLGELLSERNPDYIDEYLSVIAVSNRIYSWNDELDFELEAQFGRGSHNPHHREYNLVFAARWTRFPWNEYLPTTLALGEGISYASDIPPDESDKEKQSRWLNYLLFELEFAPEFTAGVSFFGRIHHRSGVGGLFSGVHGGSNVLSLGLRYKL